MVRRADGKFGAFSYSDYKHLNKNDIEDLYLMCINGKIKDYRENGLLRSLIQQKVNLTAPALTFPGIERKKLLSITSKPVVGMMYENSKKEKRVTILKEISKFCDATIKRVLEMVKKFNKDVKYGYVNPSPSDAYTEYLEFYEEYIEDRLKHRDQMRHWEPYVNGRPLGSRTERLE
ncbi:hypothetical protein Tco_1221704 [Tanacetum coccineum]